MTASLSRRIGCMGLILALLAPPLAAETTLAGYPQFTFKRIGLPKRGEKRITVQIDPAEQALMLAVTASKPSPQSEVIAPDARGPMPFDWYWQAVSPALADSSGRFDKAMAALEKGPDGPVPGPRLQGLQEIARVYGKQILAATVGTRVSPALAIAVIAVESAGKPDAVSGAGATGLMQLMPATASRFKVTDATDPAQNIKGGVAYLDWLMEEFGGDPVLTLAGYNAGEGSVRKNAGVPPFPETRAYVPKVLAAWNVAKGLCLTPPQLVTDGCVFAVMTASN